MKKINDVLIFVIGVLLFLISYSFDAEINLFFKNVKFPVFDFVLGIVTNFGVAVNSKILAYATDAKQMKPLLDIINN